MLQKERSEREKEELKFKLMNVKKEETPKAIPKHRYNVLFEGQ